MIKKTLVSILFILSIVPFAFWEIEGPFVAQATKQDPTNRFLEPCSSLAFTKYIYNPNYELKKYFRETKRNAQYIIFLYDQNTNYLFSSIPTSNINILKDNLLFFDHKNIKIDDKKFFIEMQRLSVYQKFSNRSSISSGTFKLSLFEHTYSKKLFYSLPSLTLKENFSPFSLSQTIMTDSGIEVINPDFNEIENKNFTLTISKNEKKAFFERALKKYFNQDNHYTAMATAITQSKYPDSNKPFVYEIGKAVNNITKVNKKEIERLNNSTILTIYAVSKAKDNKNSIIFGLAQDNTTPENRKFYYVTDLENDISILLNQ